ncbi:hypothetical protein OIU79_008910 [Salix purpurea]|uniref:Uncharacterized protein n=1 Tax=Salix purpurea TaxID=77065 RepID=A0A9Q0TJF3_SALPP|nr:hypothetical protein OIU79_008910 [Salix purpurea]
MKCGMERRHYEEVLGVTEGNFELIGRGLKTGIELYEIEPPVVSQ